MPAANARSGNSSSTVSPVATRKVLPDGQVHELAFTTDIPRSSWVAVQQFQQLHTNPVSIIVAEQPIRASRRSAQWCLACIEQLWRVREKNIAHAEREEARSTFEQPRKSTAASPLSLQ